MRTARREQRAAPSLCEVGCFSEISGHLHYLHFPFVHGTPSLSLSLALILTPCPSHLSVLAPSSSRLAKVIRCRAERGTGIAMSALNSAEGELTNSGPLLNSHPVLEEELKRNRG